MISSTPIEFGTDSTPRYVGLWILVSMLIALIVLTQVLGESQDWENYSGIFDAIRADGMQAEAVERLEVGFVWVSKLLIDLSFSNLEVYAIFAAASVALKCAAINRFSSGAVAFFLAIIFYLVCFAPLHELTQLRAAVSIALLFYSYALLMSGRVFSAVFFAAVAVVFHLSAVVLYPLFFMVYLCQKGVFAPTRAKAVCLGLGTYVFASLLVASLIAYFGDFLLIAAAYQDLGFGEAAVNPFSPFVLLNLGVVASGLVLWPALTPNMRYIIIFQLAGAAVFFATPGFQVVAFRIYELLQSFLVFFVADGVRSRDLLIRLLTVGFTITSIAAYSYIYFFSGGFFL